MVAFRAFKETSFWFICTACLLCPIVGYLVATLFAENLDFGMNFQSFHHLDLLCTGNRLFDLGCFFSGKVLGKAAAAIENFFTAFIFRAQDGAAFWTKHGYLPP